MTFIDPRATRLVPLVELTRGMIPTATSEASAPGRLPQEIAYVDWREHSVGVVFMNGTGTEVDRSIHAVRIYA